MTTATEDPREATIRTLTNDLAASQQREEELRAHLCRLTKWCFCYREALIKLRFQDLLSRLSKERYVMALCAAIKWTEESATSTTTALFDENYQAALLDPAELLKGRI